MSAKKSWRFVSFVCPGNAGTGFHAFCRRFVDFSLPLLLTFENAVTAFTLAFSTRISFWHCIHYHSPDWLWIAL
jgi:hypothetical protein